MHSFSESPNVPDRLHKARCNRIILRVQEKVQRFYMLIILYFDIFCKCFKKKNLYILFIKKLQFEIMNHPSNGWFAHRL